MWKPLDRCWKIFKQYLCNCNIHGLRYLADEQFSYFERIFWLVACALCWWGCATMIISVVQDYSENPVAVTPETTFLNWQTPFPAVILCLPLNGAIKKYFTMKPGMFPNYAKPSVAEASAEELLAAYEELKMPCTKIFRNCSWNTVSFNCCEEFHVMPKAGHGYCLAFNSLQTERLSNLHYLNISVHSGDLIVDLFAGREQLKYIPTMETFVMGNDEIPLLANVDPNKSNRPKIGSTLYFFFTLETTANAPGVKSVPIPRRNCRFRDEVVDGSFFDTYTFDLCSLQMLVEKMIKLCGCVHFYYYVPPGIRTCGMKDQQCIIRNKAEIISSDEANDMCPANCDDLDLSINYLESDNLKGQPIARMRFSSLLLPRYRYRRYVVHDLLDVVVSVGGAVGLFIGASILSIFEIPYWLFIRRDKIE